MIKSECMFFLVPEMLGFVKGMKADDKFSATIAQ